MTKLHCLVKEDQLLQGDLGCCSTAARLSKRSFTFEAQGNEESVLVSCSNPSVDGLSYGEGIDQGSHQYLPLYPRSRGDGSPGEEFRPLYQLSFLPFIFGHSGLSMKQKIRLSFTPFPYFFRKRPL